MRPEQQAGHVRRGRVAGPPLVLGLRRQVVLLAPPVCAVQVEMARKRQPSPHVAQGVAAVLAG